MTAPPDYAPSVKGVRTLYDLLFDLFATAGWLPAPERIGFHRDAYPILRRLARLQRVNQGFRTQFGRGAPNDFEDPAYVARLAQPPAPGAFDLHGELRRQVLDSFRNPAAADGNQLPWPWIPTFWPARVPNQVLGPEDYAVVIDPARPREERLAAFTNRTSWGEPLTARRRSRWSRWCGSSARWGSSRRGRASR